MQLHIDHQQKLAHQKGVIRSQLEAMAAIVRSTKDEIVILQTSQSDRPTFQASEVKKLQIILGQQEADYVTLQRKLARHTQGQQQHLELLLSAIRLETASLSPQKGSPGRSQ